jgi:hypothetical protein
MPRKNGAIITADFNGVERTRLQFTNALFSEMTIPALDGSSKDPVFLTIKLSPEFTTMQAGKGGKLPLPQAGRTKQLMSANFKLDIDGLDCSKVMRIEPLTIKQTIATQDVGQIRNLEKEPARLDVPNLTFSVPESAAKTFYDYFQDMVIKGHADEQNEKRGKLELLDLQSKSSLLTITFEHLGIFGFTPQGSETNQDTIKRVKIEMYCEQITLTPGKGLI